VAVRLGGGLAPGGRAILVASRPLNLVDANFVCEFTKQSPTASQRQKSRARRALRKLAHGVCIDQ
jgi:hypothetical protein